NGGGMYILGSDVALTNCVLHDNDATGYAVLSGGAIYQSGGSLTIDDSVVSNNTVTVGGVRDAAGGGIWYASADADIIARNTVFYGNRCVGSQIGTATTWTGGGGLYAERGMFTACAFMSNGCTGGDFRGNGGAVRGAGPLSFTDCSFEGNYSTCNKNNLGGAINTSGALTMIDCSLSNNRVYDDSGFIREGSAVYGQGGNFGGVFVRCGFHNNDTCSAIYLGSTARSATFSNCAVSASDGEGICTYAGTVDLYNCVLANNGTGLRGLLSDVVTCTVKDSIIHGNTVQIRGRPAVTYSCIEGGYSGTGNISSDPQFAGSGDYHLKSVYGRWDGGAWTSDTETSPCIDRGERASDHSSEPWYHGGRVNMGRYGNTPEASRSGQFGSVLRLR
ncbi:hypothetical protein ACFLSJ_08195, partial [Verrucomicrobiota bacterium]